MKTTHLMVVLALAAGIAAAETVEPERALVVMTKWEGETVTVEKVEPKELPIPVQRGFGQLLPLFFELRSPEKDVYYSGGIKDPLHIPHSKQRLTHGELRLVLPDIPEARHLVIMRRINNDPDNGREIIMEADL